MNIDEIVKELYEIDPTLRAHEADVRALIVILVKEKPNVQIDAAFVNDLRARITSRAPQKSFAKSDWQWWAFRLAPLGALAVLLLAFLPQLEQLAPGSVGTETEKSSEINMATNTTEDTAMPPTQAGITSAKIKVPEYVNTTITIEDEPVTLVEGLAEQETAPGSASKTTTRYFGNDAVGDINNDGVEDAAFLVTQETGGSGTFYYVVTATKDKKGKYTGTNAVFIGDRIAPQTTEIKKGEIIVNYADRKKGDAFVTPPSVGVSKYFKLQKGKLVENKENK